MGIDTQGHAVRYATAVRLMTFGNLSVNYSEYPPPPSPARIHLSDDWFAFALALITPPSVSRHHIFGWINRHLFSFFFGRRSVYILSRNISLPWWQTISEGWLVEEMRNLNEPEESVDLWRVVKNADHDDRNGRICFLRIGVNFSHAEKKRVRRRHFLVLLLSLPVIYALVVNCCLFLQKLSDF